MDRILFGDNQFFGVNHMSEEKARAQAMRFQDTRSILRALDTAYECGARAFMCTTHERVSEICDHVRANPAKYDGFKFYPGLPYAHKYANAVTDHGILGALKKFLPGSMLTTAVRGGTAIATQNYIGIMKLLVDAELKMFRGLDTPVIFLQNIVTDLLLGLDMRQVLVEFALYVKEKHGAEPGFITINLPRLLTVLEEGGLENPIICSSINKVNFRMCGGREAYEEVLSSGRCRAIAMMVLAAGAIPPAQAIEYVCSLDGIESIVFGASSKQHIEETVQLIRKYSRREPATPPVAS